MTSIGRNFVFLKLVQSLPQNERDDLVKMSDNVGDALMQHRMLPEKIRESIQYAREIFAGVKQELLSFCQCADLMEYFSVVTEGNLLDIELEAERFYPRRSLDQHSARLF